MFIVSVGYWSTVSVSPQLRVETLHASTRNCEETKKKIIILVSMTLFTRTHIHYPLPPPHSVSLVFFRKDSKCYYSTPHLAHSVTEG